MPAIIYEKTSNGLYPTGERTVSTFPSGLIRVDQTFVCKTDAVGIHRADLVVDSAFPLYGRTTPAIDGVKIYPVPQERQRDDGFTEFVVSGYGRSSTTSLIDPLSETYYFYKSGIANLGTPQAPNVQSYTRVFKAERVTNTVVMPKGLNPPVIAIPDPILMFGPPPGGGYPPFGYTLSQKTNKTNFGAFDECVTTYFYV
jgi:hypothetical protein